jgi:hypothetical protein
MELLRSEKFKLPTVYFITDRKEIADIPIGISYFYGDEKDKPYIIRLLEWEVLFQRCMESKLPFNWEQILLDNGYNPIECYDGHPIYFDYNESEEGYDEITAKKVDLKSIQEDNGDFRKFINDCSAMINMQKIRELNLFPVMLEVLEDSVTTNIHNFSLFNPYMYNKKLEGVYGGIELTPQKKNAILADISGSMTKSIATTTLLLSKSYAESFYCDLIITGSITIVYPYEILHELDVDKVYTEVDRGNEGDMFKTLVSEERHYNTMIVFGDNDHPGGYASKRISDANGKKLCKWKIDKLISFHKDSNTELAGYARWFSVPEENIERIKDWCVYLNK